MEIAGARAVVVSRLVASMAVEVLANCGAPATRPIVRIIASASASTWLRALNFWSVV